MPRTSWTGCRRRFVGRFFDGLKRWRPTAPTCLAPYADVVRGKVRERRIVFGGNQYRLPYFFAGKQIVITHGFVKKTGPVPVGELDRAERLMQGWHQHGA